MTDSNWEAMAAAANRAASAAGSDYANEIAAFAKEKGIGPQRLLFETMAQLATDDSWSGRSNDARRAYRDGFVQTARGLFYGDE